jgi:nitrite reductase/ring-hydroxylating ferredoxin subunit
MLVRVGRTLDVGSGGIAFDVDGTPVAVANVDGRLLAFDDTCTHRGYSLATGDLDGATVMARQPVRRGVRCRTPGAGGGARVRSRRVDIQGEDLLVEI